MTASPEALQRVPCIRYPVQFGRDQLEVQALLDSGSEVNAMTPTFASKLGLPTRRTNVGAQKIDGSALQTYGMATAGFSVHDKLGRVRFFEETFLLADTSMEVILGMLFLSLSNADVQFGVEELTWRTYAAAKAIPTARRVELIDKHEFVKAALDENSKTFVVHVSALEVQAEMTIHPSRIAQIAECGPAQVAAL